MVRRHHLAMKDYLSGKRRKGCIDTIIEIHWKKQKVSDRVTIHPMEDNVTGMAVVDGPVYPSL